MVLLSWCRRDDNEVAPEVSTSASVSQFLASQRAAGKHRRLIPRGLIPLLGYLQAAGVLAEDAAGEATSPTDLLVKEFVATSPPNVDSHCGPRRL